MGYFPFFIDLSGKPGLIVGGGAVAVRKAKKLLPYGPRLTVVAPELDTELETIPGLTLVRRPFRACDIDGSFFVIAATGDSPLDRHISALCQKRNILVNTADDKEACTFLFPALINQGPLSVGISTSGASPTAAVWLKRQVDDLLPEELGAILLWLEAQRAALKQCFPQESQRKDRFSQLFSACLVKGRPLEDQELEAFLKKEAL